MNKATEFIKRNIYGVIGVILLLNASVIIYAFRYSTILLFKLLLTVGIIEAFLALILFIVVGIKHTQTLIQEIKYSDSENKK